jgi:hypothetical protein
MPLDLMRFDASHCQNGFAFASLADNVCGKLLKKPLKNFNISGNMSFFPLKKLKSLSPELIYPRKFFTWRNS